MRPRCITVAPSAQRGRLRRPSQSTVLSVTFVLGGFWAVRIRKDSGASGSGLRIPATYFTAGRNNYGLLCQPASTCAGVSYHCGYLDSSIRPASLLPGLGRRGYAASAPPAMCPLTKQGDRTESLCVSRGFLHTVSLRSLLVLLRPAGLDAFLGLQPCCGLCQMPYGRPCVIAGLWPLRNRKRSGASGRDFSFLRAPGPLAYERFRTMAAAIQLAVAQGKISHEMGKALIAYLNGKD